MGKYSKYNAIEVLKNVEDHIWEIENENKKNYLIRDVYDNLSIFDWFDEWLSKTQLKDMRKFLKEAIKQGYTGYVCFKVGVTGTANGMWAYKEESNNGYSPYGPCLYKSFTPAYNYWCFVDDNGNWSKDFKTIKELRLAIERG